jgi:hypothetical protein
MVTKNLDDPHTPGDGSDDAARVDGAIAQMIDQKIKAALADAMAPIYERIADLEHQLEAMIYRER